MGIHPQLAKWFKDYAKSHRTAGNRMTHALGIPLIIMSSLGMLHLVRLHPGTGFFPITLALVIYLVLNGFYIYGYPLLGLCMAMTMAGLYYVGTCLPLSANLALFVVGWVLQFMGHKVYEKKSPSFLKNIVHLFVGPLYILKDILRFK
jgi:uncharacterized membrane protein YGL010W